MLTSDTLYLEMMGDTHAWVRNESSLHQDHPLRKFDRSDTDT